MSAAFVLSVINKTYCSCTGIFQIRLEIWPELDLAGFPENGRIPDLPEPESGTTRWHTYQQRRDRWSAVGCLGQSQARSELWWCWTRSADWCAESSVCWCSGETDRVSPGRRLFRALWISQRTETRAGCHRIPGRHLHSTSTCYWDMRHGPTWSEHG